MNRIFKNQLPFNITLKRRYLNLLNRLLLALLFMGFQEDKGTELAILISPKSELIIQGTSNIKDFECAYDTSKISEPLHFEAQLTTDEIHFQKAKLALKNVAFDCGGKMINKDFHKLLRTNEFPEILLEIVTITRNLDNNKGRARLKITIAGVSKEYYVSLHINKEEELEAKGSLDMQISDFNLEAPRKLLGAIKVGDDLKIRFSLVMKEL